jgi:RNA-binding protein
MSELMLGKDLRLALKAQAQALDPVVLLGSAGLTSAVVTEIDRALAAHSLIKVRVPLNDRIEREAIFAEITQRLGAARVQAIGKLLVLYRPPPPPEEPTTSSLARRHTKRDQIRRDPSGRGKRQM